MPADDASKPGLFHQHGGKILGAANTALIVWLYATFATRDDLHRHEARERESCNQARVEQWRSMMDFVSVKRADTTNDVQTAVGE